MNKKRNRLEVIRDILELLQTNRQVKITHIIYKANLSNNTVKPYLDDLIKNKMIEQIFVDEKKYFIITQKGREFLLEYNKIQGFIESYGLQV